MKQIGIEVILSDLTKKNGVHHALPANFWVSICWWNMWDFFSDNPMALKWWNQSTLVVEPTPLKNDGVRWDYDAPNNYMGKKHVPNHQSVTVGWVNISIRWLSCTFRGSHELKFHMESRHIIVSQHSPGSGSIQKRETKTIQNGCYWEEFIPSGRLKF